VAAIKSAKRLDPTKVKDALAQSNIETLGVFWKRTRSNYAGIVGEELLLVTVAKSGSLSVLALSGQP
jgi:hypothetical protein